MDFSVGHTDICSTNGYLLSELNDQRQLVGLDKGQKIFFGHLPIEGITPFIKLKTNEQNTATFRHK